MTQLSKHSAGSQDSIVSLHGCCERSFHPLAFYGSMTHDFT